MPRLGRRKLTQMRMQRQDDRFIIRVLEQVLLAWQDRWRLYGLLYSATKRTGGYLCAEEGALINFAALPDHLLRLRGRDYRAAALEAGDLFGPPGDIPVDDPDYLQILEKLNNVMLQLVHWTLGGRRLWILDDELSATCRAGTLEEISLSDVKFPLSSFAVQIDRPIPLPETSRAVNFLMVSGADSPHSLGITAFEMGCEQYQPLSASKLRPLERAVHSSDYQHCHGLLKALEDEHFAPGSPGDKCTRPVTLILDPTLFKGDPLKSLPAKLIPEQDGESAAWQASWRQMLQLVCGFSIYMNSLHVGKLSDRHLKVGDPADRDTEPDRKRITQGAQVCTVSSFFQLNTKAREELFAHLEGRGQGPRPQMPWHIRRAHQRRLPGWGHLPEAWDDPELVLDIPATWVREDRASEVGAPGGAAHAVK